VNAIKAGIISDIVKEKLTEAEMKKQDLMNRLESINKERKIVPYVSIEHVRSYINNLPDTLNIHPALGRKFLSSLVDKISLRLTSAGVEGFTIYGKKNGFFNGRIISVQHQ
jgi:hypothetical protein